MTATQAETAKTEIVAVIDLTRAGVPSVGVGALLAAARARLADQDKSLDLVKPRPNVARVFKLTGAGAVFRI